MNVPGAKSDGAALRTESDPRWQAVTTRDAAADGSFYYSVSTTGVYCRPSCAARRARPENVRFHSTREDAERAGFRPCKRCKPNELGERGRRGAVELNVAIAESSIGLVLVAQSAKGVAAVLLGDERDALREELQRRFPRARITQSDPASTEIVASVVRMIESPARAALAAELPLDLAGTAFQRAVWNALRDIPLGSTASYTEIAGRRGRPKAVRAVGQACGANPLAILVPCHRAVRSDGSLSGYRWGLERKRILLEREAAS